MKSKKTEITLTEEIEKRGLNPKEWVTISTARSKSKYSKRQIYKLAEKGNERIGTIKIGNTVLFNMKDILQYYASHRQKPILSPVWDSI